MFRCVLDSEKSSRAWYKNVTLVLKKCQRHLHNHMKTKVKNAKARSLQMFLIHIPRHEHKLGRFKDMFDLLRMFADEMMIVGLQL